MLDAGERCRRHLSDYGDTINFSRLPSECNNVYNRLLSLIFLNLFIHKQQTFGVSNIVVQ